MRDVKMMREVMEPFFFVQVALERAASSLSETTGNLVSQYVTQPVQREVQKKLHEFVATVSPEDMDKVKTDIESIRLELRALRSDLRELQQTTA
jgi:hypothetical protein